MTLRGAQRGSPQASRSLDAVSGRHGRGAQLSKDVGGVEGREELGGSELNPKGSVRLGRGKRERGQ